jgi:hypothetical protein
LPIYEPGLYELVKKVRGMLVIFKFSYWINKF